MYTIGIDIGGTNTRVALIDKNRIIEKKVFSTNINDASINTKEILKIINYFKNKSDIEGIGICSPGPLDLINNVILNPPNLPGWKKYKIVEEIRNGTGINAYLENDANVAALGEYLLLENKPSTLQFFTISTGIGAGFISEGRIYRGSHGLAQEVFNMVVKPEAYTYGNYQRGAIESICSGSGIYNQAVVHGLKVENTKEVFELREKGNSKAAQIIEDAVEYLSIGIANIAQIMDPEIIMLSGSLVINNTWIVDELIKRVTNKVHNDLKDKVNIQLSKENGDSGLIGAGYIGTLEYCKR